MMTKGKYNTVFLPGLFILFLLCSLTIISCSEDSVKDPEPVLPTSADLDGFWKLKEIKRLGSVIDFGEYAPLVRLSNLYIHFNDSNNSFEWIYDQNWVSKYSGEFELKKDLVFLNQIKYLVVTFDEAEIVLTDSSFPAYELKFARIKMEDYPEVMMAAKVNGEALVATGSATISNNGYLQLTGSDATHYITIIVNNPETLIAGNTYTFDNGIGILYAPVKDLYDDYGGALSGKMTINKISNSYIALDFSATLKSNHREDQVVVTDGKFKCIIKKD
jgi:hypothetical protein